MGKQEGKPQASKEGEGSPVAEFPEKFAQFVARIGQQTSQPVPAPQSNAVETGIGRWELVLGRGKAT